MHNNLDSGWDPCVHVSGVVRMGGTDSVITIPWCLLVGDAHKYAEYAGVEHQVMALDFGRLGDEQKAEAHRVISRDLGRWADDPAKDMLRTVLLLRRDPLVFERFSFSMSYVHTDDVQPYAEDLIAASRELTDKFGPPPSSRVQFFFAADGPPPTLYVTKRLLTLRVCRGELNVKLVSPEYLEALVADRHSAVDAEKNQ